MRDFTALHQPNKPLLADEQAWCRVGRKLSGKVVSFTEEPDLIWFFTIIGDYAEDG